MRTQITEDNGIRLPLEVWEQIGAKPGNIVELKVEDGRIIISLRAASYANLLRGFHAEIWEGVDPDEYVRQERDSWVKDEEA
jgi:antitoxin component of MazEF toxin-antitoxin module